MLDSSSLSSMMASSNQEEHDVEVSFANIAEEALLGGIVSMLLFDHRLLFDELLP